MLSKGNIDEYLEMLSHKVIERFGKEARIKLVVVGGAAIAINYTFRQSTMDVDTYSRCAAHLEDLVAEVAQDVGIDDDWLNHNVMVTQSFTTRIESYSPLYKIFNDVLEVHVADGLTLVCMKSVCCRPDSHDITDIEELLKAEPQITFNDIMDRFMALYDDWGKMKADAQMYLTSRFNAMPPDMIDMVWEMLPPAIRAGYTGNKYSVCNEMYQRLYT